MYGWLPLGPWRCVPTQAISSRLTKPRRICSMPLTDRKSTRLNSSHGYISYAVFCLKKKKKHTFVTRHQIDILFDFLQTTSHHHARNLGHSGIATSVCFSTMPHTVLPILARPASGYD